MFGEFSLNCQIARFLSLHSNSLSLQDSLISSQVCSSLNGFFFFFKILCLCLFKIEGASRGRNREGKTEGRKDPK